MLCCTCEYVSGHVFSFVFESVCRIGSHFHFLYHSQHSKFYSMCDSCTIYLAIAENRGIQIITFSLSVPYLGPRFFALCVQTGHPSVRGWFFIPWNSRRSSTSSRADMGRLAPWTCILSTHDTSASTSLWCGDLRYQEKTGKLIHVFCLL